MVDSTMAAARASDDIGVHEGAVELQLVDGKFTQVGKR